MNETLQIINKRYSTRNFTSAPIGEEDITRILDAGMTAPVGMRRYDTLHLTVVRNKDFFKEIFERAGMVTAERPTAPLYNAPVLIFVSSKFERDDNIEYANVGCVMENMAIAATALNLDSIYLWGFLRMVRSSPDLLAKLNLPEGFIPISALAVGYSGAPASFDGTAPRHKIEVNFVD